MPSRWWRLAVIVATATAKVSEKARQHARNDQEEYANWRRLFRCEEGVVYEGFQPLTHALPGRLNLPRECDRLCATRPRCRVSNFLPSNGTGGDRCVLARHRVAATAAARAPDGRASVACALVPPPFLGSGPPPGLPQPAPD